MSVFRSLDLQYCTKVSVFVYLSVLDCDCKYVDEYVSEDVQKFVLLCVCNDVKMWMCIYECVSVCERMIACVSMSVQV